MSLMTKASAFGISVTGLTLQSTNENKSISTAEARGEDGFIVAVESFGERKAPSEEYVVTGDSVTVTGIVLGQKATGSHTIPSSVSFSTSAGSAPTATISGQEVESTGGLTSGCKVTLPSVTISGLHHAQTFGVFSISGSGAHLTQSTLSFECEVSLAEVDGVIKASDITGGKATVTATIQVSDASYGSPTVTLSTIGGKSGVFTSPLSCSNPNGDFPTWTFTAEWPLAADVDEE